jgi:hypothetical protein
MKYLTMNMEQRGKLMMLCKEFYPEDDFTIQNWFEFCFRFLAPKVAKYYVKDYPSTTSSFAKYAVLQKLAHELDKTHPVDLLYDMWKHPENYRVDL